MHAPCLRIGPDLASEAENVRLRRIHHVVLPASRRLDPDTAPLSLGEESLVHRTHLVLRVVLQRRPQVHFFCAQAILAVRHVILNVASWQSLTVVLVQGYMFVLIDSVVVLFRVVSQRWVEWHFSCFGLSLAVCEEHSVNFKLN